MARDGVVAQDQKTCTASTSRRERKLIISGWSRPHIVALPSLTESST